MAWYSVILLILAALVLLVGILLVAGLWDPFSMDSDGDKKNDKDDKKDGKKDEDEEDADIEALTRKDRVAIGGIFITIFLALLGLFFSTNPKWIRKLSGRYDSDC